MLAEIFRRLRPRAAPALATAYLREGRILVQSSDRTALATAGCWVAAGPVAALAATDPPPALGAAVLDALDRSRVEVAVPARGADLDAPLREAAGVRSRRAWYARTRACEVAREGGELRVAPLHAGGARGEGRGFHPLPAAETARLPADAGADAVGRAVLAALERATVAPDAAP